MAMMRSTQPAVRPDDPSYYRMRAIQEQIAAQRATCEEARSRHEQLAAMYRFRGLMWPGVPDAGAEPVEQPGLEPVE